jgi:two-component sensor histidine kinase
MLGLTSLSLGQVLIAFQVSRLPPLITVVLANTFIGLAAAFYLAGSKLFFSQEKPNWILLLFPLFMFLSMYFNTFIMPSLIGRIINASLIIALGLFLNAFTILRSERSQTLGAGLLVFSFSALGLLFLIRIPWSIITVTSEMLVESGDGQALVILISIIASILWTLGYFFVITQEIGYQEKELRLEKESLIAEVHHRVKNNLSIIRSLLSLQIDAVNDPEMKEILSNSKNRIAAIGMIHELLNENKEVHSVKLDEYLPEIAMNVFRSFDLANVELKTKIEPIRLAVKRAVPCGIIVNELLTNACKYAFPDEREGRISLEFRKLEGLYLLTIEDNGVGISEEQPPRENKSLGMRLIKTLVKQLHGDLFALEGEVTGVRVSFPIQY